MIEIEFKISGKELAKVLHYYNLLLGSGEFKLICPFHEDINPSMLVNLNDGFFKCFGCGASGDALQFVKEMNKKSDDLQNIIRYYKILKSKKVKSISYKKRVKYRPDNEQAIIEATDYYYGLKTINWNHCDEPEKNYMKKRGFNTKVLNKCGAKLTYNSTYPIIFPMYDLKEFRGWVCRTTLKRIEAKRKYLYNEGFSRSNTLVGDYDNTEVVVLVEGYMDRLKFIQFGSKKVCAILGWKITDQQIKKLKDKGVKYIISALDMDDCGNKGTRYLSKFFKVIRFQFPKGVKDPGELTKEQFKIANNKTKEKYRGIKKCLKKVD